QIAHIPYKGTAPALTDLLGGQVDMMCDNLGVSLPHVRSGKLKALAVASAKRIASQPGVPALAETFPGFEAVAWFAIVGPPRTPSAIAEKVGADVREALKLPEVQKRLADRSALAAHGKACDLSLEGLAIVDRRQLAPGELRIGEVRIAHGRAALDAAEAAIRGALAGEYHAVVAAPHTEAAVKAAHALFDGYPSFVARVCGLPA